LLFTWEKQLNLEQNNFKMLKISFFAPISFERENSVFPKYNVWVAKYSNASFF